MEKLFPMMLEEPEAESCGVGIAYGLFAFLLMPALLSLSVTSALGMGDDASLIWYELAYHGINFGVMLLTFFGYLREAFFNVVHQPKKIFGTAGICAAVIGLHSAFARNTPGADPGRHGGARHQADTARRPAG